MTSSLAMSLRHTAVFTAIGLALSGCGTIGDTGAIKEASEYAIDCQPDMALATLGRAQSAGGLSAYIAELEKIVVLQDAGREKEAAAALQSYHAAQGETAENRAQTEKSIQEALEELRDQRLKRSGQRTCAQT